MALRVGVAEGAAPVVQQQGDALVGAHRVHDARDERDDVALAHGPGAARQVEARQVKAHAAPLGHQRGHGAVPQRGRVRPAVHHHHRLRPHAVDEDVDVVDHHFRHGARLCRGASVVGLVGLGGRADRGGGGGGVHVTRLCPVVECLLRSCPAARWRNSGAASHARGSWRRTGRPARRPHPARWPSSRRPRHRSPCRPPR